MIEFFTKLITFLQIVIKPSSLSKMKTIFTQEIFTEQVCAVQMFFIFLYVLGQHLPVLTVGLCVLPHRFIFSFGNAFNCY